jgi:PAS domain S-box-containing protein
MVNNSFCRLFKVKREDFVGRTDNELFPEREWKIFREKDTQILTTGIADENEENATIPGGEKLRVLTQKSLLMTGNGKKYVLGVVTDITEKTQLLARLKESENKYKTIFNLGSDPAGLFLYPERRTVEVNDAFLAMGGVSRKSLIGKTANNAFKWVDMEERDTYIRLLEREKSVQNMEIRLCNHRDEVIPFLVSARLFRIRSQSYVLISLRDISELKRAEAAVRENEKFFINKIFEAEEKERARIAADLHDDLGPTLSTVKFHLGVLEKSKDPEKIMKGLETFEILLNEVIKKVHQISHSISPHMIGDFGLESAVGDFCRRLSDDHLFHITFRHNIQNLRFPKDIELHFYRIILELLNNSMKHSGSKKMSIDLHYRNGGLSLRYSDGGKGYKVREILKKSPGMGISNIIQRVSLVNGDIRFLREKGRTVVAIRTRVGLEDVSLSTHTF